MSGLKKAAVPHTPVESPKESLERRLKKLEAVLNTCKKKEFYISDSVKNDLKNGVKMKSVTDEFLDKLSSAAKAHKALDKHKGKLVPTLGKTTYLSKKDESHLSRAYYMGSLKKLELYSDFLHLCKEKVDLIERSVFDHMGTRVPYWPNLGIPGAKLPGLTAHELENVHKLPLSKGVASLRSNYKRINALLRATGPRRQLIKDAKTLHRLRTLPPAQAMAELAKLDKAHKAARKKEEEKYRKKEEKELKDLDKQLSS